MVKKKNMKIRIICALLFFCMSSLIMFSIYHLSSENAATSNKRSEEVTNIIKQGINTSIAGNGLADNIKSFILKYSPYGSDWNVNIRKIAHFVLYFILASAIYLTLTILGINKRMRFMFTIVVCMCFALGDEFHQKYSGRTYSMEDVYLDTFAAFVSASVWTIVSMFTNGVYKLINICILKRKIAHK